MRIMRFHVVFSKGSSMHRLGLFLMAFGVSGSPSWSQVGPIWASVGSLGGFLGVLGGLLGALWDQFGFQLGDFVPSWKPCDANLGISWVTLSPLGSDLASFGYLVCE